MGFGRQFLQAASEDAAKVAAKEVVAMESEEAPTSDAQPPVSPASHVAAAPPPAPASSAAARPNAFARPSFAPPAAAPSHSPAPAGPSRPSFGPPAAAPAAPSARPSLTAAADLPNVRGVFVRDPNKLGASPSAPATAPSSRENLSPQALFEIVCTHRNMSPRAIEAARNQAQENPDAVMAQMRRIYDNEIALHRNKVAADLPHAQQNNPDKAVFLLRKEGKEKIRIIGMEEASASGELLLNGATVESVHAAASPFRSPSELFRPVHSAPAPEPAEPARPSLKP